MLWGHPWPLFSHSTFCWIWALCLCSCPCPSQFFTQQPDGQKPESDLYPSPLQAESGFLWQHQMIWPACLAVFSLPCSSNRPPAIAWAWGVLVWELPSVLSAWNHLPQIASLPHLCPKVSFSSVTSLTTLTVVFLSFLCSAYHSHLPLLTHPENTFCESRLLPWGPALSSSGTEGDYRSAN